MKLIIDIPEKVVTAIQNGEDYRYDIHTAIAQGIPYEERPQVTVFAENASKEEIEDFKNELEEVLEKPQGEWIGNAFDEHHCSKCGHPALWEEEPDGYYEVQSKFCPACGLPMKIGGAE